ncbi:MAG: hypothetical protein ACRDJ4_14670 [Actinomycetota bacterium]
MWLWWLGNVVFLLVVIPTVLLLLNKVLRPAREIKKYADDILENGVKLTGQLDAVPALLQTRDLVKQVSNGAGRYVGALNDLM